MYKPVAAGRVLGRVKIGRGLRVAPGAIFYGVTGTGTKSSCALSFSASIRSRYVTPGSSGSGVASLTGGRMPRIGQP